MQRPDISKIGPAAFFVALFFLLAASTAMAEASPAERDRPEQDGSDAEETPEVEDERWDDEARDASSRRTIGEMNRQELEQSGFVFEDTLTQRYRAHATLFALTAGAVVHGAGHRQLGDSRTAWFLVGMEAAALALIGGGVALALNPTGNGYFDDRRRDLWQVGVGLLGMSWLIDIFGTAYRDDLGVPASTARDQGWGMGVRYEYWRPRGLALRHLATVDGALGQRHFQIQGRTSQELGYGMSDYEVIGRWFPFVGADSDTRAGLELGGRFLQYRLDDPFERVDATLQIDASINLGRIFGHLDNMTAGMVMGLGIRGYRFPDLDDGLTPLSFAGLYVPIRMFLALNLTDQLRFRASFERWQGGWLERSRGRIGVPKLEFTYRSTDRLDLEFFSAFGNGIALGAGLRIWLGE